MENPKEINPLTETSITIGFLMRNVVLVLGLSLNQAAAYVACFLWKLDVLYYLLIVFIFTLIFSYYARNLGTNIACSVASVVGGVAVGLAIVLIPPIVYGSGEMLDTTATFYLTFVASRAVFSLVVSLFAAILGSLMSGES